MVEVNDKHLFWVQVSEDSFPNEAPSGIYTVYRNFWWVMHPTKEEVAFWRTKAHKLSGLLHPQANQCVNVATTVRDRMYPWARVVQVPIVIQPGVGS